MSSYFSGPKPVGGKAASLVANEKPPKVKPLAPKPKVPKKVPLPPSLGGPGAFKPTPKTVHAAQKAAPKIPKAAPVNTAKVQKAPPKLSFGDAVKVVDAAKTRVKQQHPNAPDWALQQLAIKSLSPKSQFDPTSHLTLPQVKAAGRAGTRPTIAMQALNSAVHPLTDLSQQALGVKPLKAKGAISDVANIASNFIPAGKVGAAGLFGARALKGAKVAADAIPEDASIVRGALKGAKGLAGKQVSLQNQERGVRFAAAKAHLNNQALDPADRVRLAKQELAGELPKINFQGFNELNPDSLKALQSHILDHPHLLEGQKIRASDALSNALAGKVPTKSELTLLQHVFGKDTAAGLGGIAKHPFKDTVLSVLNIPRSLMASFDLSAPFRQGLVVSTRHPQIFAKNFGPMIKAFGSEKVYHAMLSGIRDRPTYPMMMEAGLSFTELGSDVGAREERFASDLAEKIPIAGHGVRASGRAYTGYLDKTRADVFDHLIQSAQKQGIDVQDQKFLKSLGTYINSATGRGDLGHFQEAGKVLNTFFFSPRLLASRLNFLNPVYYSRLDPFARKEALRSAVQLAGTLSTLLALASQIKGVKVVLDPRNPDWGKIKKGNTRIDLAGGFQQPLRLLAQLASGTAISSTTGKKLNLTANGFGQATRLDLGLRFFEGKESPIASLATDWLRNSNQVGQKFSWKNELSQRMIPLLGQDSYDLYKSKHGGMNGLEAAFAGYGVGSVGFGFQTYGPRKPKAKSTQSGGASPYFGTAPGGTGSPYFGSP